MVLALAERPNLSGIPAVAHALRSDSSGNPLLGFGPPTRYIPSIPPTVSRPKAPLLGFMPLQRIKQRVSTPRQVSLPGAPTFPPGVYQPDPSGQLRCRPQVFPTSRRPSSTLRRPTIFRQVALLGFPLQGFAPLAQA